MTKVIQSKLQGKNSLNVNSDKFKVKNNDNFDKDLFALTHEAENNLKIIIEGDLKKMIIKIIKVIIKMI